MVLFSILNFLSFSIGFFSSSAILTFFFYGSLDPPIVILLDEVTVSPNMDSVLFKESPDIPPIMDPD
jgi:hypothetical protein|tara:strand:- start:182 stop:382 length:201 start_codon:yes stop_codon:yes gene_type:complete